MLVQDGVRRVEGKSQFSFDHIFGEDASTSEIYDEMVRPIVWGITEGKHGTAFCYGQTGSGKTHTMQGNDDRVRSHDGVVQLAVKDLFRWNTISKSEALIKIAYIEIYNERVVDLLAGVVPDEDSAGTGSRNSGGLSVRDDPVLGVQVNCEEIVSHNVDTALDLLQFGNRHRQTASTKMNARSSRSHAIFRITVEMNAGAGTVTSATLNLVDLAGSESSQSSDTTNARQREGGRINKSLLSLSKVINSLSLPPAKRPNYISYRDSKLTFILQPHLSGNALMAVLCCVSPAAAFVEETRSTLRFAARAKLVETKAEVNHHRMEGGNNEVVQELNLELDATRSALQSMEKRSAASERSSLDAVAQLHKIKELIFGDGDFELSALGDPATIKKLKKKKVLDLSIPTIDETKGSYDCTENFLDHNTTISALTFQRVTQPKLPESNQQRSPPTEVLFMTGSPQRSVHSSSLYTSDMQQRGKFLEHRLQATEDLVEILKSDLQASRNALHQLVHKNVRLASKVERLNQKKNDAEDAESDKRRGQYVLLKWSMYLSLFFFFFQLQDLFIVMIMFLWLSLEAYTTSMD